VARDDHGEVRFEGNSSGRVGSEKRIGIKGKGGKKELYGIATLGNSTFQIREVFGGEAAWVVRKSEGCRAARGSRLAGRQSKLLRRPHRALAVGK